MKPIIGITPSFQEEKQQMSVHLAYCSAIVRAGGVPIILPYTGKEGVAEAFGLCHGLLLSGGEDIDPALFGEEPHPKLGGVSPTRDAFELALCRLALAYGLPVLGVCRGMQLLGVAGGGTMIQDIPAQTGNPVKHSQQAPRPYATHGIEVRTDSRLYEILGTERLRVNSFHHQAVDELGERFVSTACAADGIIEAIECPAHPFALGVQWHPEFMTETPAHLGLFEALVCAAAKGVENHASGFEQAD